MKDCGACGYRTCKEYMENEQINICPTGEVFPESHLKSIQLDYDFRLSPLSGEPSARKFILPFRPDLVEKFEITEGNIVIGRPAGAGCPVYHSLKVISSNYVTGVLECHSVGPLISRNTKVHDIQSYHVHAFEGIVEINKAEPTIGVRQRFLPTFCMIQLVHTAVVSQIIGNRVRLEDIRIL